MGVKTGAHKVNSSYLGYFPSRFNDKTHPDLPEFIPIWQNEITWLLFITRWPSGKFMSQSLKVIEHSKKNIVPSFTQPSCCSKRLRLVLFWGMLVQLNSCCCHWLPLYGQKHWDISQNVFLHVLQKKECHTGLEIAWTWVNEDRTLIFGWTTTLKTWDEASALICHCYFIRLLCSATSWL